MAGPGRCRRCWTASAVIFTPGGCGWGAAAKTTCGGLGAFIEGSAAGLTDRSLPLGQILDVDETVLIKACAEAADEPARIEVMRDCVTSLIERADPSRIATAREVAAVVQLAEADRSMRRIDDLAAASGIGV